VRLSSPRPANQHPPFTLRSQATWVPPTFRPAPPVWGDPASVLWQLACDGPAAPERRAVNAHRILSRVIEIVTKGAAAFTHSFLLLHRIAIAAM